MKRTIIALILILGVILSVTACTESEETSKKPVGSVDNEIYGIWHSPDFDIVLEITEGAETLKYYSLVTGYYAYAVLLEETYTYDVTTGILLLTLEGKEYTFLYEKDADILSCNGRDFERQEELPTEHPNYPFPDFASIDLNGIVNLPDYHSFNLYDVAMAEARIEIFASFYDNGLAICPTITDRPAAFGDIVIVDYVGHLDGVPFLGGTADDAEVTIVYQSGYIPGFAEGIIGHSVGETFDVPVTFPENYGSADLAGRDAVFTMTLKTIYDVRLSEAQFNTFENVPYETYEEWVEAEAAAIAGGLALTMIAEEMTLVGELPAESYMHFYQSYLDYAHYMAAVYNMDYEQFCLMMKVSDEMFLEQSKSEALSYVLAFLIAAENDVTWSEEDYNSLFDSYVKNLIDRGYTEADAILYVNNNQLPLLKAELISQTVVDWLGELTFVAPTTDED